MKFKQLTPASSKFVAIATAATAVAAAVATTSGFEIRRVSAGVAQAAPLQIAQATSTTTAPSDAVSFQNLYVNISDKMIPSVVNIFTTKKMRVMPHRMWQGGNGGLPEDFFNNFFGGMMVPRGGNGGAGPGAQGPGAPGDDEGDETQPQSFNFFSVPNPNQGQSVRRQFIAQPAARSQDQPMSLGTGFIVEAEGKGGLILTNYHVIAGADDIKVKFTEAADDGEVPAQLVGKDPELDVALLRVRTDRKLTPVALGDSDRLKVGEWVAAVGNPFGHGHSITHGIVSAKERSLPGGFGKYLQVDAPINPGNSGGPLVNLNAEVVGINNAIDARGPGIGFAIPINSVKAVIATLKSGKEIERGYLGVNIMPIQPDLARALKADVTAGTPIVAEVVPGTPAAKAGIEPYDVITRIDGHAVHSTEELMQAIMQIPVGDKAKADIVRGGKHVTLDIPVSKRPDPHRA